MIDLPLIKTGLPIGEINLVTRDINPSVENPIHFTCISRINCCTEMRIPASTHDIDRILDNGYELDQIVKDLSPVIINPNSPQGPKEKAYILKTKPFDGTCTFLENKLCSIHEFKPFACRIYPFALDLIDNRRIQIIIHEDKLCHSIKLVPSQESNNYEILKELLDIIIDELLQRGYPIGDD